MFTVAKTIATLWVRVNACNDEFFNAPHQWRNLPPNVESHFVHQLTINRSTTNQWDNQWILIKEMDLAPFLSIHEFTPRIFF
jgi:hypothetical protein